MNTFPSPTCAQGNFCENVQVNRGEKAKYIIRGVFGDWNN